MKFLKPLAWVGVALASAAVGTWFALQNAEKSNVSAQMSEVNGENAAFKRFLAQPLATLEAGKTQNITGVSGKKLTVVNLWATWCAPCREEMPEFVAFRNEFGQARGLEFVGVAIDREEPVRRFIAEQKIDYPILFSDISAIELTKAFGNERMALPFSFVVDASGTIVKTKLGKLTRDELLAISAK
jgi:thiol-disulfide isomerase/thioredoxin